MKLKGNTILVTGGSAGIGLAFAKKLVALGNEVIVTGRSEEKLQKAKEAVPVLHTIPCDAAKPADIERLAERVRADHPKLNVLMNNAGIFLYKNLSAESQDLGGLTTEIEVNLAGPIRTVAALIDIIKANKGTIINVTSGLAFVPLQCAPVYCATKAGLHSYTISLRQQLADYGVEVIEIAPPAVKTELTAELPEDGDFKIITTDELLEQSFKGLRSGKLEICPGQASQLRFMSRLAPSFINGQLAKGSRALIPSG